MDVPFHRWRTTRLADVLTAPGAGLNHPPVMHHYHVVAPVEDLGMSWLIITIVNLWSWNVLQIRLRMEVRMMGSSPVVGWSTG